ncbi:hypothetical protein ACFLY6_00790 [Candidatus Dependentiae bacterium]
MKISPYLFLLLSITVNAMENIEEKKTPAEQEPYTIIVPDVKDEIPFSKKKNEEVFDGSLCNTNHGLSPLSVYCSVFWCGCFFSSGTKHEKFSNIKLPPDDPINIVKNAKALAKKIILLKSKGHKINVIGHGYGSLVACCASQFLEATDRSFEPVSFIITALLSAASCRMNAVRKAQYESYALWKKEFTNQVKKAHKHVQQYREDRMPNQYLFIEKLTLTGEVTSAISKFQPSEVSVMEISDQRRTVQSCCSCCF